MLTSTRKSQLAIEYAHQVAERNEGWIFWIHAETRARVEDGFRTIADAAQLPERNGSRADIPRLVHSWLSNRGNGRWLIVVDSADDRDVFYSKPGDTPETQPLASYLPQSDHGSILVTTRDKDLAFRLTGSHDNIIDVGPMSEQNALTLLETRLGSLSDQDRKLAVKLVDALERIPLAISQAAAYIRQRAPRISVEKYLAEFQEGERKRVRLLAHDAGDLRRGGGASNSILTTWRISFERIRSERPSAADLLSLMSFFDRQGIPEDLLKPSEHAPGRDKAEEVDSESSDGETDDTFEDDIAMLRDYCLVNVNRAGDMFEMHGLVQLSTRRWLQACGLEQPFQHKYIELMNNAFPTPYYNKWTICRRLFAHVRAAAAYRPAGPDEEKAWATLLYHGGWYASAEGSYALAERMLRKAAACFERRLGLDAEATLTCRSDYANVLGIQGRFDEAETLQTQTLEKLQTILGPRHRATINSRYWLTILYWKRGRYQQFEGVARQTLEAFKTTYGETHLATQAVAISLALSHTWQGKEVEEAKGVIRAALGIYRDELGPHNPATLWAMESLVVALTNLGELEEARKLGEEALEAYKTRVGQHHPLTLVAMANLGITLRRQGLLKEAEELHREVWETRKSALGPAHSGTLGAMHDLACTWHLQDRDTEAAELMRECIALRQRVLGPEHPDTERSAGCLRRWGDAEDSDADKSSAGGGASTAGDGG
jgi:tetratricopeptide (TPR) repeat protein